MRPLPYNNLHNPEIRENFEEIEVSLSQIQLADIPTPAEVGGTKAKKIKLVDANGKFIGYIPVYSA